MEPRGWSLKEEENWSVYDIGVGGGGCMGEGGEMGGGEGGGGRGR